MSDDAGPWAAALDITPEQAAAFERLAAAMQLSPAGLLRLIVERVLRLDREMGAHGLRGLEAWVSAPEAVQVAVDHGLDVLPLDIRPTGFMWPADKPFPWSAEECRAAVIGYQVRWKGEFGDFLNCLRGKWEMSDGYAFLHQT